MSAGSSIILQCDDCCLLALRGKASTAIAQGEDSYTVSLDKYLNKTETTSFHFVSYYIDTNPEDPSNISEEDDVSGTRAQHWEVVEATEGNPHPDPRYLTVVVTQNSPDAIWYCSIIASDANTTYTPSPTRTGRPRTLLEDSATFGNVSYTFVTGVYVTGGYSDTDTGSSFSLSSKDTYAAVRDRLSASQAGGWAFGYYGFDPTDIASFGDSAWPGLGYYSAAGGTYYGLWQIFNPIGGCVYGGGEAGDLSLFSNTTNFGLPMANHPYFVSRYTTYELDVAHNFRRFYQLRDFHGCFSAKGTGVRTLVFEKVIRSCWLKLETVDLCTAATNVTTDTKNDNLYAETEIYDPVDQYGSTEYNHASWSNANCSPKFESVNWSTDSEDLGVKHSDFCYRNKLLFVSSIKVKITVQKTVINYKDVFDDPTNPDWAAVLATQVSAPIVTTSTIELTNEARVGGFFTSEVTDDFKVRPSNYRQVVWLKITRVFTTVGLVDTELSLLTVSLYCARRYGNMGFPQLDDQAAGGLYKGVRGFKKNSRWFSKMRMVHSETLLSSGSCPAPSCTIYTKSGIDLATEVEFECLQDTALTYDSWTDTRKVFERDWRCTGATSSLGEDEWSIPFVDRSGRAPIWGSFGFSSSTATTATKNTTETHNRLQYGIASQSAIPYRYLNAEDQQEQDKIGDAFTVYEGCSTNSACTNDCTGSRSSDYSQYRHAATTTPIADPFYGFDNIVSISTQTVSLDNVTTGYFGKKDIDDNRLTEDAVSTDVLHFSATSVGTYVTIRNFWLK